MTEQGFKRKLTAIFSADAVGYSRLMADDEAATVKTIGTYREAMISLIKQHRGRVVDSPGDNILAEFSSVVDAVQCAVAVQNEFQTRNAELAENRRMEFRIGINLGDVIDEENRIYGDGVNVAARLEALADPGGICVSKTAFDQIETKLPLGYEYLGEQSVKNIPKPVGAYKVLMQPRVTVAGKVEKEGAISLWRRKVIFVCVAAVLILAVAVGFWQFYMLRPTVEPASKENMAFPLPEKPSIAVLSFDYMGDDPDKGYIANALSENIISALSKIPDLFVIAKESSFSYKGKEVKIKQISEELGVRYVLEGSLQKSGDKIRVTAQLIDAIRGHHLWSDSYDRELKDFFALQDDIILNILNGLQVELTILYEGFGRGTSNPEALFNVHNGIHHVLLYSKEDLSIARKLYKEAIELDPKYAFAYNLLGWTYIHDVLRGYTKSKEQSFQNAEDLANKALELDPSLAEAHAQLAYIFYLKGQFEKAIVEGEESVEIDPKNYSNLAVYAMILNSFHVGKHEKALTLIEQAIRINPKPASWVISTLGDANMRLGRYREAIDAYKKVLNMTPNYLWGWVPLTVCYVEIDQMDQAKKAAAEVLRIQPLFCIDFIKRVFPSYQKTEGGEKFFESLRRAGIPEHSSSSN